MKYLYTLFALFLTFGLSGQSTTITFSEAGLTASACDGNIKGDSGVTATIGDDGAGNKYLSASSGAVGSGNDWKNTQIRLPKVKKRKLYSGLCVKKFRQELTALWITL